MFLGWCLQRSTEWPQRQSLALPVHGWFLGEKSSEKNLSTLNLACEKLMWTILWLFKYSLSCGPTIKYSEYFKMFDFKSVISLKKEDKGNPEKVICPVKWDKELKGFFFSTRPPLFFPAVNPAPPNMFCSFLQMTELPRCTLTRYDVHLVEELQPLNKVPVTQNTWNTTTSLEIRHIWADAMHHLG